MTMASLTVPPSVEVWLVRSRSWWSTRQPRERMLMTGLVVLIGVFLFVNGVWGPLRDARRTAHQDIRVYDDLASRLRAAGPTLRSPSTAIRSGSIQAVVTLTAGESALAIRQIEQEGAATTVVLDGVNFAALIAWLDRLERDQGISVTRAAIERQIAPGVVNARLSLVRS